MAWLVGLGWLAISGCGSSAEDGTDDAEQSTSDDDASDDDAADDDASDDDAADDDAADDDAADDDASDDDAAPLPAPMNHRAERESCDNERPAGGVDYGSPDTCTVDEDCTDGVNGRCLDLRGAMCTYDQCFEDSECGEGPCGCEMGFWSDANACLGGNCQIDADCGEEGYCSPSFGPCGNYSGVVAYYCRTPQDTCVEDSECVDPDLGGGYCAFYPEVGYWACQYGQCVG